MILFAFLLAEGNLPFAVALGLMLVIAALEGTMTLLGAGMSEAIDALLPDSMGGVDIDADIDFDADADIDFHSMADGPGVDFGHTELNAPDVIATSALSRLLGWLCIGKVPVLVLLVVFLTIFGLSGLIIQSFVHQVTGSVLPSSLASIPALLISVPCVRYIGLGLSKLIPKDESSAVSSGSFIGRIGRITVGTAKRDHPAEAKLSDQHGQTHYVMVEPDDDNEQISTGTDVLLVARKGNIFQVIKNTNAAMVDK